MQEDLLNRLCVLARLELSESERGAFATKFAQVLEFVGIIQALGLVTREVPPFVMKERQEAADDTAGGCELTSDLPRDYRVGAIGDLNGGEKV